MDALTGHIEPERYAIATRDMAASLYVLVESALFTVGAASGCILLPSNKKLSALGSTSKTTAAAVGPDGRPVISPLTDWTPTKGTGKKQQGGLRSGLVSPPLSPGSTAGGGLETMSNSSSTAGASKLTNTLRMVALVGSNCETFANERLHKGVLKTGIAVNGTSQSTPPFLCFPIPSMSNFRKRLGLFIVSGKTINTGSIFSPEDESAMSIICRQIGHVVSSYQLEMVQDPYNGISQLKPLRKTDSTGLINQPSALLSANHVTSSALDMGSGPLSPTTRTSNNPFDVTLNPDQLLDPSWQIHHQQMASARQQVFRTATSGGQLMRQGALSEACDIPDIFQLNEIAFHFSKIEEVLVDQRNAVVASEEREEISQRRIKQLQTELLRENSKVASLAAELEAQRQTSQAFKSQLAEVRRKDIEDRQEQVAKLTHTQMLEKEVSAFLAKKEKSIALSQAAQLAKEQKQKQRDRRREEELGIGLKSVDLPLPAPTTSFTLPSFASSGGRVASTSPRQSVTSAGAKRGGVGPVPPAYGGGGGGRVVSSRSVRHRPPSASSVDSGNEQNRGFRSKAHHAIILAHK